VTICPICRAAAVPAFQAQVLRKYAAEYLRCPHCGYLWAAAPYWLEEAYCDAIVAADTGIAQRNYAIARKLANLLYFCLDSRATYVDAAGGYGLLVRLMRDFGFDFYWQDKYCQNLMARGFEYASEHGPVAAVTAIEVLEHTPDPVGFIRATLERFATRTLIFTTMLYAGDMAPPRDWWYYAFATGQHVSFFQARTLEHIAATLGLRFVSWRGMHILTDRPLRHAALAPLLLSRLGLPLAQYVEVRLGSKTMADHHERMRG